MTLTERAKMMADYIDSHGYCDQSKLEDFILIQLHDAVSEEMNRVFIFNHGKLQELGKGDE